MSGWNMRVFEKEEGHILSAAALRTLSMIHILSNVLTISAVGKIQRSYEDEKMKLTCAYERSSEREQVIVWIKPPTGKPTPVLSAYFNDRVEPSGLTSNDVRVLLFRPGNWIRYIEQRALELTQTMFLEIEDDDLFRDEGGNLQAADNQSLNDNDENQPDGS